MKRALGSHAQVAVLNERGLVLIAVLWVFMVFFVIALGFSSTVREEGLTAHRFAQESEDYYLALAGFQHGLYELLRPSSLPPQAGSSLSTSLLDEGCRKGSMGQGGYRVCVADEGGRVNLNRVDEQTLRQIFLHLGVEESLRAVLVDSIMDWRDNDHLHRLNGAENDYYLSLSPPYTARNGPFEAVEDLLWVRGVTPELFYGSAKEVGLNEIFTVDSPMDRINLGAAPAEVIHAVLGLSLEASRKFEEDRKGLSQKTVADLLGLLGIASGDERQRQFVFVNPSVVTLKSEGFHDPSGGSLQVKGVVRLLGGGRGFELLRWVDRDWRVSSWKPE
jgi:general secretion pathway protein K